MSLKKETLVIAGYYGFGNAGDELILLALIRKLRTENSETIITVLSADPAETARSFGVQAVDRWRPWCWVRPLMDADRFILGGGGLLQETTGPWNYLYYLALLVAARICGCTTEVYAIGVDPISRKWNRFCTRFVLHHWTDSLSVRDMDSREALVASGVRSDISIVRDPVFDLGTVPSDNRGAMALALSSLPGVSDWPRKIASLCDRLSDDNAGPIDLLVLFPAEDESLALEVARLSAVIRQVRVCTNPPDLLAWIPQYQVIAGSRFHALVLAAVNHIPFFAWSAHPKVLSLCREFHRPFWKPGNEWNLQEQVKGLRALYQSSDKTVILKY